MRKLSEKELLDINELIARKMQTLKTEVRHGTTWYTIPDYTHSVDAAMDLLKLMSPTYQRQYVLYFSHGLCHIEGKINTYSDESICFAVCKACIAEFVGEENVRMQL